VNAVEFQGVSKSYSIYDSPGDRLKELLSFNRFKLHKDFWALHDVSFQIQRGETFCIVGENGSGKSTLLQMIAGILHPSSGSLTVNGRVSALLELGAGFNPESAQRTSGLGLISMQERLRLVGGHLSVESEPSHGTRIRVRIPRRTVNAEVDTRG